MDDADCVLAVRWGTGVVEVFSGKSLLKSYEIHYEIGRSVGKLQNCTFFFLYNSPHCGTSHKELIDLYRQTHQIVFVSSTHATCFGHYWPTSGIKYMIFKTQNKIHMNIHHLRYLTNCTGYISWNVGNLMLYENGVNYTQIITTERMITYISSAT